ncbi:hypothetical protein B0H12DRAFT_1080852 [Mycena haematopus]|nr:hypothetical protein B0H12DRAFT_1080852 [Mycena haematopus]
MSNGAVQVQMSTKRPGVAKPGICNKCIPPQHVPALQSHDRRVHSQKATVKYADGVEDVIHRNPDSQSFHCKRCPYTNGDGQNMRRHCEKNCTAVATAAVPDDPDIRPSPNHSTRASPELLGRTDVHRARSLDPDAEFEPIPRANDAEDGADPDDDADGETDPDVDADGETDPDYDDQQPADQQPADDTDTESQTSRDMPQPGSRQLNVQHLDRRRTPDQWTIVHHPTLNLPAFDIVINTLYHVVICLSCGTTIELGTIEHHIHAHFPSIPVPNGLAALLTVEYDLVTQKDIQCSRQSPAPIYGLLLPDSMYYFCDRCGRGYADEDVLYSHQHQRARCPNPERLPHTHRTGYGQCFTMSRFHRIFRVDPLKLPRSEPENPDLALKIYKATRPPPIDYSHTPFVMPLRQQDQNMFLKREGWGNHILPYTPAQLAESSRLSTDKDPFHALKDIVEGYIQRIQPEIQKHASFGMQKLIANVGLGESMAGFNTITSDSCQKYGRFMWRLVFNLLRQIKNEGGEYKYPLTDGQTTALKALAHTLKQNPPPTESELHSIVHKAIWSLFAHCKTDNRQDKYFNAVNCFFVITSFDDNATLRVISTLTSNAMQLIYANRTSQLTQIRTRLNADRNLLFMDAYNEVTQYLTDRHETPMSFLFNSYNYLKVLRTDEHADEAGAWLNVESTSLRYDGDTIEIRLFNDAYIQLRDEYERIVREEIYMGFPPPPPIPAADLDPSNLVDDPTNRAPGYCFLDDIRNPCATWKDIYIDWLLSIPQLRRQFTLVHEDQLIWRPGPCMQLMAAFDRANDVLVVAAVLGSGGCLRGTEFASEFLRNGVGAALRNNGILFKNFCFIGILGKTSHHYGESRFIPVAPPRELVEFLIHNLGVFRPAQELWAGVFLGPEHRRRFHEYLHPRVKGNLTSGDLSHAMADITETVVKARLPITKWRKVVETIMRRRGDPHAFEISKKYFFHAAGNHSASTANAKYQQASGSSPGISPEHIAGCIKHCIAWQRITGIDGAAEGKKPLTVSTVGSEAENVLNWGQPSDNPDVPTSPRDMLLVVQQEMERGFTKAVQQLEGVVQQQIAASTIQSQALYYPRPPPVFASHELPDVANFQPHPSRRRAIREMLGEDWAGFSCPEQAIVLEKMISRTSNVLYVGSCGSGKTWLNFMAAAVFGGHRITIAILSHSGLHLDFVRRAAEMGVSCSKWDSRGDYDPNARIVWAAVEHIECKAFHRFASALAAEDRLDRFFWDEIHRLFTDVHYRDVFLSAASISQHGVPIFASSGTIPPSLLPEFRTLSGIQNWDIVRMEVSRRNIRLEVKEFPDDKARLTALVELVNERCSQYDDDDRAMIFVQSKTVSQTVATLLHTEPFHADQDPDVRQRIFREWRDGAVRVIVATTILGSGTDYPAVRDVYNLGLPYTMPDAEQQTHRAGRDGYIACATTLVLAKEEAPFMEKAPPNCLDLGKKILTHWAHNKVDCRRLQPSLYFDGRAITCSLINGAFCDNCDDEALQPAPPIPKLIPIASGREHRAAPPNAQRPTAPVKPRKSHTRTPAISQTTSATANSKPARSSAAPASGPPPIGANLIPPKVAPRVNQVASSSSSSSAPLRVKQVASLSSSSNAPLYVNQIASSSSSSNAPLEDEPDTPFSTPQLSSSPPPSPTQPPPPSPPQPPPPSQHPRTTFGVQPNLPTAPKRKADAKAGAQHQGPRPKGPRRSVESLLDSLPDPNAGNTPAEVKAQKQASEEKRTAIRTTFDAALALLRGKCPACWALGYAWDDHSHKDCTNDVAKDGDQNWSAWHREAFEFAAGFCWFCLIPQPSGNRGGWHPWYERAKECIDKNLLKPALFAFLTAKTADGDNLHITQCSHVPQDLFPNVQDDMNTFREWCREDAWGPLLNIHYPLLWLIFQRKLVQCPAALRPEFPDSP